MRKSLWIMLAVLLVAIAPPAARADTVTLDLSGSLSPTVIGTCSPSCTLGGDIVIDNTAGTVTSVNFTVAGESPFVGPFNMFDGFLGGGVGLVTGDSAGQFFEIFLAHTLVGYTGGAIGGNISGTTGLLFDVTGAALTKAVGAPEPNSVGLMLLGVGLVLVMRKRIGEGLPEAS